MLYINPIEQRILEFRKEGRIGSGEWPGSNVVWARLQQAAHYLSKTAPHSSDHIEVMAVMGTGHEELMKYWVSIGMSRGWIVTGSLDMWASWKQKCG